MKIRIVEIKSGVLDIGVKKNPNLP